MAEPKWAAVKKHCTEEIERLRSQLESHQPDTSTQFVRGEIAAIRRLLALETAGQPEDPRTMIQPEPPLYG